MFNQSRKKAKQEAVLRTNLNECLKEAVQSLIQPPGSASPLRVSASSPQGPLLGHSDNTNALCNVIEALFIHGLKHSFGDRMSQIFRDDPDVMPVPNFWPVLMVISHRDLLEEINSLNFITSEVGKGRAWIRLVLNGGQLWSYLSVLAQDTRTLKDYYRPTAFLQDMESCDIMLRILQPLSSVTFKLATNAAVLNTWTQTPLLLSGIWSPALSGTYTFNPVLAATDVASTVLDERDECHTRSDAIDTPLSDHMFDLIIRGTPETSFISDKMNTFMPEINPPTTEHDPGAQLEDGLSEDRPLDRIQADLSDSAGDGATVASSSERVSKDTMDDFAPPVLCRELSEDEMSLNRSTINAEYELLFKSLPEMNTEMPSCFPVDMSSSCRVSSSEVPKVESPVGRLAEEMNFVILPSKMSIELDKEFLSLLPKMTQENGLDSQKYQCYNCGAYIGVVYGQARVCRYDSRYHCLECLTDEQALIPARILHNWDFVPYPVCTSHAQKLAVAYCQPLLNLRVFRPCLYTHIEELKEMKELRTQLTYIRAYLFTCKSDAKEKFQKMLWPKDYLYEHVHLYSVADLESLASGSLLLQVKSTVIFGREHVLKCPFCTPRGFFCELCSQQEIIFPFQLDKSHTCRECCAVYHRDCFKGVRVCPRCVRNQKRNEELSFESGHESASS